MHARGASVGGTCRSWLATVCRALGQTRAFAAIRGHGRSGVEIFERRPRTAAVDPFLPGSVAPKDGQVVNAIPVEVPGSDSLNEASPANRQREVARLTEVAATQVDQDIDGCAASDE